MIKKLLKITIAMMLFGLHSNANNLQITNVSLASINTANHFIMIKFDISWENSWRTNTTVPYNWDAAWIFVKYRINGDDWHHATLSPTSNQHIAPVGSTIDAVSDSVGVFMYRSANGTGTNNWINTQVRWNYGSNGVSDAAANVEVRVLGIEMVYVPQDPFYAGDNTTIYASFKQGSADNDPWYIGSENTISVTNSAGSGNGTGATNAEYYYVSGGMIGEDATGTAFTLQASFPKGYNAFYCMKYEITQGQYTEFLNILTRTQQNARVWSTITTDAISNIYVMSSTASVTYRNYIVCPTSGNGTTNPILFSCSTPDIACNFLCWADGTAYTDWAGLRPMSELEFEKACRGPLAAVSGEYAWGTATIATSPYTLSNAGAASEAIATNYSSSAGNASYNTAIGSSIKSPLRVGIFAANAGNTGRITSDAGYYGAMELSGNLCERIVTVGNPIGRGYTGSNGNGILSTVGNADVAYWPDNTATGSGFRGGGWSDGANYLNVSDRDGAASKVNYRYYEYGFRAVRCP